MTEYIYEDLERYVKEFPAKYLEVLENELQELRDFRDLCPSVTGEVTAIDYPKITVGNTVLTVNPGSFLDTKDDWHIGEKVTVWHDGLGIAFHSDTKY